MSGIRTNAAAVMLGVSPNTLRSWERRYGFPSPQRSPGGHRQYALAEIEALRMTMAETHNVSSAVSLARERGEPFELGDYTIPPGVEINPSIAGTHRRGDRYPAPLEFRPERFLGDDAPDTYTWIPFGGGTRRCLGASFALQEMRVVTRRILARTELVAEDPRPERMLRRGITQVPRNGVRVIQAHAPAVREEATTRESVSSVPEGSASPS